MTSFKLMTLIFMVFGFTTLKSYAATTKTSVIKAKKKSSKGQQTALSQGYSASEALLMGKTRWNFVANHFFTRGFDEYVDSVGSTTTVSMSYRLNNWSALSLSTGFSTIALNYDGRLYDNQSSFPELYGMNDTTIGWSIPNVWKTKSASLNYLASVTVPTSKTSQLATLRGSMNHAFTLRYRPSSRVLLFANTSMTASNHRLDTTAAVIALRRVNSPFGLSYGVGASIKVLRKLFLTLGYSQFQRLDYEDQVDTIQTARLSLNYVATAHLNVFAGYRYRDLTITNESLFDDDRSLAFIGGSYAF